MEKIKYKIKKQEFFNWYFQNVPEATISKFLSNYLLGLVHKEARFTLDDLLNNLTTVPSDLILNWLGKPKQKVKVEDIILID